MEELIKKKRIFEKVAKIMAEGEESELSIKIDKQSDVIFCSIKGKELEHIYVFDNNKTSTKETLSENKVAVAEEKSENVSKQGGGRIEPSTKETKTEISAVDSKKETEQEQSPLSSNLSTQVNEKDKEDDTVNNNKKQIQKKENGEIKNKNASTFDMAIVDKIQTEFINEYLKDWTPEKIDVRHRKVNGGANTSQKQSTTEDTSVNKKDSTKECTEAKVKNISPQNNENANKINNETIDKSQQEYKKNACVENTKRKESSQSEMLETGPASVTSSSISNKKEVDYGIYESSEDEMTNGFDELYSMNFEDMDIEPPTKKQENIQKVAIANQEEPIESDSANKDTNKEVRFESSSTDTKESPAELLPLEALIETTEKEKEITPTLTIPKDNEEAKHANQTSIFDMLVAGYSN